MICRVPMFSMPFSIAKQLPIALLGSYALLQLFSAVLPLTTGDQGVYYYASWLWAQGVLPYRDFFISHPPLHLLPSTLVVLLFGARLPLLNALPPLFGLLSGILIYRIARDAFGQWWSLFALAIFLFSYAHLVNSAHFTGVNIALFLLLLGLRQYERGHSIRAGAALACGVMSGVYVFVGAAALSLIAAIGKRRSALPVGRQAMRMVGAFAATLTILHLPFLILAGRSFLEDIYLYHLAKTGETAFFTGKAEVLWRVVETNMLLTITTACAIPVFLVAQRRWKRRLNDAGREALLCARGALVLLGAYLLFFLLLQRLFTHYFLLLLPPAVLLTTFLFSTIARLRPQRSSVIASVAAAAFLMTNTALSLSAYAGNRAEKRFENAGEIAALLEASLREDETIYGDFAVVPTLALLSGRRIAANEIDSSIMRFESGTADIGDIIAAIEADNVRAVLGRANRGIVVYPPFRAYLLRSFMEERTFSLPGQAPIILWRRTR